MGYMYIHMYVHAYMYYDAWASADSRDTSWPLHGRSQAPQYRPSHPLRLWPGSPRRCRSRLDAPSSASCTNYSCCQSVGSTCTCTLYVYTCTCTCIHEESHVHSKPHSKRICKKKNREKKSEGTTFFKVSNNKTSSPA